MGDSSATSPRYLYPGSRSWWPPLEPQRFAAGWRVASRTLEKQWHSGIQERISRTVSRPPCKWRAMERANKEMPTKCGHSTRKVTRPGAKWLSRLGGLLILVGGGGACSARSWTRSLSKGCAVWWCRRAEYGVRRAERIGVDAGGSRSDVELRPIEVSKEVTFDQRQGLASSFRVGAEYDFEIDWFSRVVMNGFLHQIQSAQDYRPVG